MNKANILFTLLVLSRIASATSYTVPAPQDLASSAIWEGVEASAEIVGGELLIDYKLPSDLVGNGMSHITAKGTVASSNFIPVSGNKVRGMCLRSDLKPLTCLLHYPTSIVDVPSRDMELAKHFTGEEFDRRSKISNLFSADPAGLLSVELK